MGGLSSLVIAESDPLTREAVKYAFEREGISVALADSAKSVTTLLEGDGQQLVIVGAGASDAAGVDVLQELRAGWKQGNGAVPLLYLGEEPTHEKALAAGATQCLPRPTYARDIVTAARLLANRKHQGGPATFVGELGDFYGLYYVVRAVAALRWRGVLTLVRGLRRGELRLYEGEVTSAQVGVLHGLAALHQLCLWTDARIELRVEDVVRRRQIPLTPAETLTDIERFLAAIRDESGALSPSSVFEQDATKTAGLPKEVLPVLRLFDGARTVADIIEDSPYRVFETIRVSARLAELSIINRVQGVGRKSGAHAALAIEEWLVGGSPVPARAQRAQSEPVGPRPGEPASPPGVSKRRKKRKKNRRQQAAVAAASPDNGSRATDWSAVLPSMGHTDLPGYAAVVPSVSTGGEISMDRERLEDVTSATQRNRIFGGDVAPQVQVQVQVQDAPAAVPVQDAPAAVPVELEVAVDEQTETKSALASLPAPTERLAQEADEAVHAAHDAASAAMLAIQAARAPVLERSEPEPEPERKPVKAVDGGWDDENDTEAMDRVALDAITAQPPAKVLQPNEPEPEPAGSPEPEPEPEPTASGELETKAVVEAARGEVDSGGISVEPAYLRVDPAPVPTPHVPTHPRAATPSPALDAQAAAMVAHAAQAAHAVAVFSAQEEEFFKAGSKIQSQHTAPIETFDDLETEPPKTFWQRLVSRPEAVPRAGTGPIVGAPTKKKR